MSSIKSYLAAKNLYGEKKVEYANPERSKMGLGAKSFGLSKNGLQLPSDEDENENCADQSFGPPLVQSLPVKQKIDPQILALRERQPLIEIPVVGVFDDRMADVFEYLMKIAIESGHKMVVIRIDSPGGSVYSLNRMLNSVESAKRSGMKVITVCTGIAMSCGSIMLAMGSKGYRFCGEHARVLLHEISGKVGGNQTNMENELAEYAYDNADLFRKIARNAELADTNYYLGVVKSLHRDLFIHPHRALWLGLVDHVGSPLITREVKLEYSLELPSKEGLTPEELDKLIKREETDVEPLKMDVLSSLNRPDFKDSETKLSPVSAQSSSSLADKLDSTLKLETNSAPVKSKNLRVPTYF